MEISAFGNFAIGLLAILFAMMCMVHRINSGTDSATRHLYFGAVTMTSLALVFVLGMGMYYFAACTQTDRAKTIFETVKQIIPPFLTLVMGYFFGQSLRSKSREDSPPKKDEPPRTAIVSPDKVQ